jgi:hypothetical protein
MASLAVVSTSRPRHRHAPDVGALVADLRRQHGKQASNALFEMLSEDEALARAIAVFVVEKLAAPRRRVMPSAKERAEHRVAVKAQAAKLATRVKERILLDQEVVLLSGEGKALRFTTGAELTALGGAYLKLGERVGPTNMTGEVMVEAEIRALLS